MALMYQVSTLQALAKGDFYGNATIGELLTYGDTGLGTFQAVDGEMIVLDGECYRAKADGTVELAEAGDSTPFASVTFLKKEHSFELAQATTMQAFLQLMEARVQELGANSIYACRVDGSFSEVYARSEKKQQSEPYKSFAKVLETDQREFEFTNVHGSLIGVYFPKYMDGLNVPGWHVHFISDDRTKGGHVFDFTMLKGSVDFGAASGFAFTIPKTKYFQTLKLTDVSQKEIESVEKASR